MKLVSKQNFLLVLVMAVFIAIAISLTMVSQQRDKESSIVVDETQLLEEVSEEDADSIEESPEDTDNLDLSL